MNINIEKTGRLLLDRYNNGINVSLENTILIKSICYEFALSEADVLNILKSLKLSDALDVEGSTFRNEVAEYKIEISKKKVKSFKLIIPINCGLPIKHLKIYNYDISFKSGNVISQDFKNLKFNRYRSGSDSREIKILSHDRNFIIFDAEGYTFWNALANSFKVIETLSGLINYAINDSKIIYGDYNSSDEADFSIDTIVYSVDNISGEKEYVNWNRLTRGLKAKRSLKILDKEIATQVKKIVKVINRGDSNNSISELIATCFRMYYYAESAVHKYDRFMHFWRICETISLSDKFGGQTKIVSNRNAKFIPSIENTEVDKVKMFRYLASIRNGFVHRGVFDADDNDINILKIAVDNALYWIMTHSKKIKTVNELEFYYKIKDSSKKDLGYMHNIIQLKLK
jgi:hypothetical protein